MGTIVVIFVAILFSAFFSGMEIAFVSANRLRVELDKKQGAFGGRLAALFVQNPGQFISTMLVGNNIALVIFGLVFSRLLAPVLSVLTDSDAAIMVIQTILSTLIMLLVA
jgi:CBS domain containing-hemolysin-like protein